MTRDKSCVAEPADAGLVHRRGKGCVFVCVWAGGEGGGPGFGSQPALAEM